MMSLRDSYWFDLPARLRRRIRESIRARRAARVWRKPKTVPYNIKVIYPECLDMHQFTAYRPSESASQQLTEERKCQ